MKFLSGLRHQGGTDGRRRLPLGFKTAPAALNFASVQRHLCRRVRPAWYAVLASDVVIFVTTVSMLLGYRPGWMVALIPWAVISWVSSMFGAFFLAWATPAPAVKVMVRL